VHDACATAGHAWRERVLGPMETVGLLLLQVLHGNVSCRALCRISGVSCTAEAYCQARARLPIGVLRYLLSRVTHTARGAKKGSGVFKSYRQRTPDRRRTGSDPGRDPPRPSARRPRLDRSHRFRTRPRPHTPPPRPAASEEHREMTPDPFSDRFSDRKITDGQRGGGGGGKPT